MKMKKITLVLLCVTISMFLNAQTVDNSLIVGTWQLKSINCEKYFSYDGYKKEFRMGDELKNMISKTPADLAKRFAESMPNLIAKSLQETYFLFETNNDYISISSDSLELGSFEIYDNVYKEYKANHRLELSQGKLRQTLILKKDSRNKEVQLILTEKKDPPKDLLMLKMYLASMAGEDETLPNYETTYIYTYVMLTGANEIAAKQKLKDARQSKKREDAAIRTMEILKKKAILKADEDANGKLYTIAEKMPSFVGGDAGYASHTKKILQYYRPKDYLASAGTYIINVSFTVNIDGTLSQIVADVVDVDDYDGFNKDNNWGMVKKATEIFSKSPKWIPAQDKGVNVRYRLTKKITFVVPE